MSMLMASFLFYSCFGISLGPSLSYFNGYCKNKWCQTLGKNICLGSLIKSAYKHWLELKSYSDLSKIVQRTLKKSLTKSTFLHIFCALDLSKFPCIATILLKLYIVFSRYLSKFSSWIQKLKIKTNKRIKFKAIHQFLSLNIKFAGTLILKMALQKKYPYEKFVNKTYQGKFCTFSIPLFPSLFITLCFYKWFNYITRDTKFI